MEPTDHQPPYTGPEQRRGDRRTSNAVVSLLSGARRGKRRDGRRTSDLARGFYVDWYEPHFLCLIVAVLLLSCADALLTLSLLALGARELNVFMDMLIHTDVQLFTAIKMAMTGAGLLFLVIHHRFRLFRRVRVEHTLRAVLLFYLAVVGYELMLLAPVHTPIVGVFIVLVAIALAIAGLYLDARRAELAASAPKF